MKCTKSINNVDMYYYKGKRISSKNALKIAKKKNIDLAQCKTVQEIKQKYCDSFHPASLLNSEEIREYKNDVVLFKANYEASQNELVKCEEKNTKLMKKYDEFYNKLNDAADEIEVMNKVCLSKEFRKQIDAKYKEATEELTKNIKENDVMMNQLKKDTKQLNNQLDKETEQRANLEDLLVRSNDELNSLKEISKESQQNVSDITKKFNELTDTCRKIPSTFEGKEELQKNMVNLKNTIKDQIILLKDQEKTFQTQLNDYKGEITNTVKHLSTCEEKYKKILNALDLNQNIMENNGVLLSKLQQENESLKKQVETVDNELIEGKKALEFLQELKSELKQKSDHEKELFERLNKSESELNRVKEINNKLSNQLKIKEDEDCFVDEEHANKCLIKLKDMFPDISSIVLDKKGRMKGIVTTDSDLVLSKTSHPISSKFKDMSMPVVLKNNDKEKWVDIIPIAPPFGPVSTSSKENKVVRVNNVNKMGPQTQDKIKNMLLDDISNYKGKLKKVSKSAETQDKTKSVLLDDIKNLKRKLKKIPEGKDILNHEGFFLFKKPQKESESSIMNNRRYALYGNESEYDDDEFDEWM